MCSTGPGGYSPARALRSPMSLGIRRTRYNPDMSNNPQQKRRGWAIPALPLGLLAALYLAGYFTLGEHEARLDSFGNSWPDVEFSYHSRTFPMAMIQTAYYPMGWLESKIRGECVTLRLDGGEWTTILAFGDEYEVKTQRAAPTFPPDCN